MISDGILVPPHSIEAEQAVLGAVILRGSVFVDIRGLLSDGDFYRDDHRQIWKAFGVVADNGDPVDLITVSALLKDFNSGDNVLAYLGEIAKNTPSASNAAGYAKRVREFSTLRQWLSLTADINQLVYSSDGSLSDRVKSVMELASQGLYNLEFKQDSNRTEMIGMKEALKEQVDHLSRLSKMKEGEFIGLSSGSVSLDEYFNGVKPGFFIIAGRPSMGKTAFMLGLALAAAESPDSDDYGDLTAVFSLETDTRSLVEKMICTRGGMDYSRIQAPHGLSEVEWSQIGQGVKKLGGMSDFYFNESTDMTVDEIRLACRKLVREQGKKMRWIGVDYLQIMKANITSGNRTQEIGEISRGLKSLVKEFDCPVVALSQLNRGVESRPNKRPMMSDLRESGDVEQDADAIMFVYRDEYYTKEACETPGVAEILVTKNKKGKTGTVMQRWEGRHQRFVDYEPDIYVPDYSNSGGSVSSGAGGGRRMTAGMRENMGLS